MRRSPLGAAQLAQLPPNRRRHLASKCPNLPPCLCRTGIGNARKVQPGQVSLFLPTRRSAAPLRADVVVVLVQAGAGAAVTVRHPSAGATPCPCPSRTSLRTRACPPLLPLCSSHSLPSASAADAPRHPLPQAPRHPHSHQQVELDVDILAHFRISMRTRWAPHRHRFCTQALRTHADTARTGVSTHLAALKHFACGGLANPAMQWLEAVPCVPSSLPHWLAGTPQRPPNPNRRHPPPHPPPPHTHLF